LEKVGKFPYKDLKSYEKFRGIMAAALCPYLNDGKTLNLDIIPQYAKDLVS